MQTFAPLFVAAAAIIICLSTSSSFIAVVSAAKECNSYTPLPSGVTTYEVDDGGCFFCATQPHAYETLGFHPDNGDDESDNKKNSAIPLSGDELSNHCATLCNADPKCIAYTIARPAVLEADLYMWDKTANCCLDRMEAPNELYVDANMIDPDHDELSECQLGAMCWTRFEREVGGCSDEELHGVPDGSDQCTMVWGDRTYTPDEIEHKIKYVNHGCYEDSETFYNMLHEAYDMCKAEVDSELGNFDQFEDGK